MAPQQLFVFGFGYTARFLGWRLSADPVKVAGTTRSPEHARSLRKDGWEIALWPGEAIDPPKDAAWLISAPPEDAGCPVFRAFASQSASARWIGYLSTTGVYGDLQGGWASEETPCKPLSREARNRVTAEDQWLPLGANVFRLPGIYGPGRSAFDRLREPGVRRIIKPAQVFSRIYVIELAGVLRQMIQRQDRSEIFNVCDDEPAGADLVLEFAAGLLGLPSPPAVAFEDANLSPAEQRFYMECKRVSNGKIKAVCGALTYPTYREGLRDILDREPQGRSI